MQTNYVAYYRVSTQMQGKSGLGLEAQRVEVEKNTRNGSVIAEFTEIESGKRNDRPQLQAALEFAKANNATLVIAKLDRLSRDLHFLTGFIKEGVPFIACDLPHANKFTLHIMGAVAEQERDFISERTKAAIQAKIAQGVKWGTNTAKIERANMFAQSIHTHVQTITQSGIDTPAAIAAALNERGIRTPRGAEWGAGQVVRLLRRIEEKEFTK
ncbi:DNA invertase Pin-like site-specific DNA recombinase [Mycoplana sp. BE70]|uniref:recombinase family protein n=1 Tax=Mycoplana sp. BE70 TaxID=2817775 RepID=UPI002862A118|nr:recombinase family protein [Mycoplana sp. BE70]MDR6757197.1 DNA invertase Pin-like site-specific DNA recombinase [Mycoplana sp. BE70]